MYLPKPAQYVTYLYSKLDSISSMNTLCCTDLYLFAVDGSKDLLVFNSILQP